MFFLGGQEEAGWTVCTIQLDSLAPLTLLCRLFSFLWSRTYNTAMYTGTSNDKIDKGIGADRGAS